MAPRDLEISSSDDSIQLPAPVARPRISRSQTSKSLFLGMKDVDSYTRSVTVSLHLLICAFKAKLGIRWRNSFIVGLRRKAGYTLIQLLGSLLLSV